MKWYLWAIITILIFAGAWIWIYLERGFDPVFHISIVILGALDIWINVWGSRDLLD